MIKLYLAVALLLTACSTESAPQAPPASVALRTPIHVSMGPLAAPKADVRPLTAIQQASCGGPSGWRCPSVKPLMKGVSTLSRNVIPTSWTVQSWFIDPANSTETASDNNDCVTASTPCLTWAEIYYNRMGCAGQNNCPRWI